MMNHSPTFMEEGGIGVNGVVGVLERAMERSGIPRKKQSIGHSSRGNLRLVSS
jgi:hypothetical protein